MSSTDELVRPTYNLADEDHVSGLWSDFTYQQWLFLEPCDESTDTQLEDDNSRASQVAVAAIVRPSASAGRLDGIMGLLCAVVCMGCIACFHLLTSVNSFVGESLQSQRDQYYLSEPYGSVQNGHSFWNLNDSNHSPNISTGAMHESIAWDDALDTFDTGSRPSFLPTGAVLNKIKHEVNPQDASDPSRSTRLALLVCVLHSTADNFRQCMFAVSVLDAMWWFCKRAGKSKLAHMIILLIQMLSFSAWPLHTFLLSHGHQQAYVVQSPSTTSTTTQTGGAFEGPLDNTYLATIALQQYEFFHSLPQGSASTADLHQTSAGLLGWVTAFLPNLEHDILGDTFNGHTGGWDQAMLTDTGITFTTVDATDATSWGPADLFLGHASPDEAPHRRRMIGGSSEVAPPRRRRVGSFSSAIQRGPVASECSDDEHDFDMSLGLTPRSPTMYLPLRLTGFGQVSCVSSVFVGDDEIC